MGYEPLRFGWLLSQSLTTAFQQLFVACWVAAGAAEAAGAPTEMSASADTTTTAARPVLRVNRVLSILVSRAPMADGPNVRCANPPASLSNAGVLGVTTM